MRKLTVLATVAALATAGTVAIVIAQPASAETATFAVVNSWNNGYQAEVSVVNATSSTITSWKVQLTLPAGTSIASSWSATEAAAGATYTFTPANWNGKLAAGASTTFGFVTNGTGRPTSCQVNGQSCGTGTGGPPSTPTAVPTTAPTTAPTARPTTSAPTTPPTTGPKSKPPTTAPGGTSPLAINGQLHVCGVHLCNQSGTAIQLRGMSTPRPAVRSRTATTPPRWTRCANDWQADFIRIAMYVQEGGFETDPAGFTNKVNGAGRQGRGPRPVRDRRLPHPHAGRPQLQPGPGQDLLRRRRGRATPAKKNVLYEIANEPNGVSWAAHQELRRAGHPGDPGERPGRVVIVGTRGWSSLGVSDGANATEIVNDPVDATNIMYTFHFYAASHGDDYRAEVPRAAPELPLFVTEFGTVRLHRRRRHRHRQHHRLAGPARPAEDQLRQLDVLRRPREQRGASSRAPAPAPRTPARAS